MGWCTQVLAGLLGRWAGLLPPGRRDWAEAVLGEAGEVPAGAARVAWLGGGLWLVAREVLMRKSVKILLFAAGAAGLVWATWPGPSTYTFTPVNRMDAIGMVALLALLPPVVRRYAGPVRRGWWPRAARLAGYAGVLALIVAKAMRLRYGVHLGSYFTFMPDLIWAGEVLFLVLLAGYVAGLLILTSRRMRVVRPWLPVGAGVVTALVLYALQPLGQPYHPPGWLAGRYSAADTTSWWLAALAVPLVTGLAAARLSAPDLQPGADPVQHASRRGCLAATTAMATAALLLAVLTSVTIALFPGHVALSAGAAAMRGGGCPSCGPRSDVVIPPGLRHEYQVDGSVHNAGTQSYAALFIAPLLGAALGTFGGALARRRDGSPHLPSPPGLSQPPQRRCSDADREQVIAVLKAAFVQGRLTKDELDARAGHAFTSATYADLAALTADIHPQPRPG